MELVIKIPKEFEGHFKFDRFGDSLFRLREDAHCLAGNYEKELCDMLIEAFDGCVRLPKGHGRLIDINGIDEITLEDSLYCMSHEKGDEVEWSIYAPTVVDADEGKEE